VKIIADTNLLVRAAVRDDRRQSELAAKALRGAEVVAVSTVSLCEFTWVLRRTYGLSRADIAASIRDLLASDNVVVQRAAVEAGLAMLDAGGDFADGLIAWEGRWLGGETFVSFDRRAVGLLESEDVTAKLLR
jgi:predicted nucleic-acid-binding protein